MKYFIICALAILTALCGQADIIVVDGVEYEWSQSDKAYVVAGLDQSEDALVARHIHLRGTITNEAADELDVAGIKAGAFADNTDIELVEIDEGIAFVGAEAFSDCNRLQRVTTPSTLVEIGADAFNGCVALEHVVLGEGLVTIGERAFAFCEGLEQFVIPSTVRDIKAQAFMGCTSVTDVYFLIDDEAALTANPDSDANAFVWWDGWYRDYGSSDPHGGIEFNGSRKPYEGDNPYIAEKHNLETGTLVHVPQGTEAFYRDKLEAWLVDEDTGCHPLWWIVNHGAVGRSYTVCDPLTAVYAGVDGNIYAKDAGHWLMPDKVYTDEVDYISTTNLMDKRSKVYDQSNWVALQGTALPAGCYVIAGGTITGRLLDKRNPVIEVTSDVTAGPTAQYEPNVYVPASVMSRTQVGLDGRTYAFVRPKPQEYARYDWTVYHPDNEFYVPAPNGDTNKAQLRGGFVVDYTLYEDHKHPEPDDLTEGYCYPFLAITRRKTSSDTEPLQSQRKAPGDPVWQPYTDGGLTIWYDVLPLSVPVEDPVITSVGPVEASADQMTRYYDLMGHQSPTPLPGINIVVTRRGQHPPTTTVAIHN